VVAHQYRDQLDLQSKGSTLNVGNMIIFRITGRDSYELASQFDNTPPPADTRVEPVYAPYEYQGHEFLIETQLNTGEGGLYNEVELPRRPYSDTEAEMANKLSSLPDWFAWCRLIRKPDDSKERPSLEEIRVLTEHMTEGKGDPEIAAYIRERSRNMARTREEVEEEILSREFWKLEDDDGELPTAQERSN